MSEKYTRDGFCLLADITVPAYKSDRRQGFLPSGAIDQDPKEDRLDDAADRRHSRFRAIDVVEYVATLEFRNLGLSASVAASAALESIRLAWSHFDAGEKAECYVGVFHRADGSQEHFAGSAEKLAKRLAKVDVDRLALVSLNACFDKIAERAEKLRIDFPPDIASAVLSQ